MTGTGSWRAEPTRHGGSQERHHTAPHLCRHPGPDELRHVSGMIKLSCGRGRTMGGETAGHRSRRQAEFRDYVQHAFQQCWPARTARTCVDTMHGISVVSPSLRMDALPNVPSKMTKLRGAGPALPAPSSGWREQARRSLR